jgi:rod shape-determining protein MreD
MNIYSYIILNTHKIMPFFIISILSIVSVAPIMPTGSEEIAPLLGVISLTFWILYKPELTGWIPTIVIGIINDVLYGSMLGVSCLAAVIIRIMIIRLIYNREINLMITFICLGLSLIIWLLVNNIFRGLFYPDLYNYYNLIFQFLVSIVISPIVVFFQLFLLKKMSI